MVTAFIYVALWTQATFPPLEDVRRFPPLAEIEACLEFNRQYRACLEAYAALEPWQAEFYRTAGAEAEALADLYELLRVAQSPWWTSASKRDALRRLRERIGYEAYYQAKLPPPVPIWRFRPLP